jgi:hypothetical protein
MPMDLPHCIAEFFRRKNEHDDAGLALLFSEDATVIDGGEGTTIHGRDEINAWVAQAISGLHLHTEIASWKGQGAQWIIDTVMTGDFKASPARFLYTFELRGEKISLLRVEFLGSLKERG